jgi:hypothetical protein
LWTNTPRKIFYTAYHRSLDLPLQEDGSLLLGC